MQQCRTVLVTGAAGFIGSHTCVELLAAGHDVVGLDDFSNSSPVAVQRISELAGRSVRFLGMDIRDRVSLDRLFRSVPIDCVVHFAAKKAVGESVQIPLDYYGINVGGTVTLLDAMCAAGVKDLVFSSSCSIYGEAESLPILEDSPKRPTNPYARTKWMCEQVLADLCVREPDMSVTSLRYFNPVGAHPGGRLGEDPRGVPNNVMPYLMQVGVGRLPFLRVFGVDYPTVDGSGVRDYLHVVDLAEGHRVALEALEGSSGMRTFNLGTGTGTSVLELIQVMSDVTGLDLPYVTEGRRSGDVAALVADPTLALADLGWKATRDVHDMCRDAWQFQRNHPNGYQAQETEQP